MLGADVLVLEPPGLLLGFRQRLLERWPRVQLPAPRDLGEAIQRPIQIPPESGHVDADLLQERRDHPVVLSNQRPRQMLGIELLVLLSLGVAVGALGGLLRLLRPSISPHHSPRPPRDTTRQPRRTAIFTDASRSSRTGRNGSWRADNSRRMRSCQSYIHP